MRTRARASPHRRLKSVDDGRRFGPEVEATIKTRLLRHKARLKVSWMSIAQDISGWEGITNWFPGAFDDPFENSDGLCAEEANNSVSISRIKPDRFWPITERVLHVWINGDTSRGGERRYPRPTLPKIQAIVSYLLSIGALHSEDLEERESDQRAAISLASYLRSANKVSEIRALSGRFEGLWRQNGDACIFLNLKVDTDPIAGVLRIYLNIASIYRRISESEREFRTRENQYDQLVWQSRQGWGIILASGMVIAFLRPEFPGTDQQKSYILSGGRKYPDQEISISWCGDDRILPVNYLDNVGISLKKLQLSTESAYGLKRDFEIKIARPGDQKRFPLEFDLKGGKMRKIDQRFLELASCGDTIGVAEAIGAGANINTIHPITGETALHMAARLGATAMRDFLLNAPEINPNVADNDGFLPSDSAIRFRGDFETGERLIGLEVGSSGRSAKPSPN